MMMRGGFDEICRSTKHTKKISVFNFFVCVIRRRCFKNKNIQKKISKKTSCKKWKKKNGEGVFSQDQLF